MRTLLQNASYWIVLLPLIVGCLNYQRLTKQSKIILLLTAIATPPQFISLLTNNEPTQNLFYNVYTILEFLILYWFFYTLLTIKVYRKLFAVSLLSYLFVIAIIVAIHGILKEELACAICINNLTYCFWILLFIYFDLKENISAAKLQNSLLYYTVTIFLYASVTCIYFALKPYTDKNNINVKLLHNFSNIQMYVCFTIGFLIDGKNHKPKPAINFHNGSSPKLNFSKK